MSGVNAAGEVVGVTTDGQGHAHGFVDINGSFKTYDPAGSILTSVQGVTAAGEAVGTYDDGANTEHGFTYKNGVITTIDVPGATFTSVTGFNDAGAIVGTYGDSGGNLHGFLDYNAAITTIDIPGAIYTDVQGINAAGQVFGFYNDATGQHGFATSQIAVDPAPIANPDTGIVVVGTPLSVGAPGGVLANDTNLDADTLTVTGVSDAANGTGAVGSALAGVYGHLTLNADGSYSYTADNSAAINSAPPGSHLHDVFSYVAGDGDGGTSNAATLDIAVERPPVVTTSNISSPPNQTLAASSLFTTSDPEGNPITEYEFWDNTDDPASGHFYLNGAMVAPHTLIDVPASQLGQVTFVTGTVSNLLQIRAFDGVSWSAAWSAWWSPFNVSITLPPPPVVTTSNISSLPNQTFAASSLFTASDPASNPITEYEFWDNTDDPASGHFYLNGAMVAPHTLIDVPASQLGQVTFVTGTVSNLLQVRAFDGVSWSAAWSAWWSPFNVSITLPPPPVVTTSNISSLPNQTFAASSLFTASDPASNPMTEYEFWDNTDDPARGHFYLNGAMVAPHTLIDVPASQLGQVTFVTGTVSNLLQVRAFDGVSWSAA